MTRKELAAFRKRPCLACGDSPSDVAHIRSKGAGGKSADCDVIPLCRIHHITQHAHGWKKFFSMHPNVQSEIERKGWEFTEVKGRFLMFRKGGI